MRFNNEPIVISGFGAVSPLGLNEGSRAAPAFVCREIGGEATVVGALSPEAEAAVQPIAEQYPRLDRVVHLGMAAAREALRMSGQPLVDKRVGVMLGSSRGATDLFERYHSDFISSPSGRVSPHTSPTTTLGCLSSWTAHDLDLSAYACSLSATCSTSHQAIANATAWLKAGMVDLVIAGGAEAPLTPFTLAQFKALRLYADGEDLQRPCRPFRGKNTLVISEGAAVFILERESDALKRGATISARIVGYGFAQDEVKELTGLEENGRALFRAMSGAVGEDCGLIDTIYAHAPGTIHGDAAEQAAIKKLFADFQPQIAAPKELIGHSFGASGALSMVVAISAAAKDRRQDRHCLINAQGFGGNAGSLYLLIGERLL